MTKQETLNRLRKYIDSLTDEDMDKIVIDYFKRIDKGYLRELIWEKFLAGMKEHGDDYQDLNCFFEIEKEFADVFGYDFIDKEKV